MEAWYKNILPLCPSSWICLARKLAKKKITITTYSSSLKAISMVNIISNALWQQKYSLQDNGYREKDGLFFFTSNKKTEFCSIWGTLGKDKDASLETQTMPNTVVTLIHLRLDHLVELRILLLPQIKCGWASSPSSIFHIGTKDDCGLVIFTN